MSEKKLTLKEKIKREASYMKKGARVLPKAIGKKVKTWSKEQFEAAKQRAAVEREIEQEAKKVEQQAYRTERLKQAKLRAVEKAKLRASGKGGIFAQLGEVGERLSTADLLGFSEVKGIGESPLGGVKGIGKNPLLDGLGEKKKPVRKKRR